MGIRLKVTTQALKDKAVEVETNTDRLQKVFENILETLVKSNGYWIGEAGNKARNEFNAQKENTLTILKRFREHPKDLLVMAGVYEENEHNATAVGQSLNSDIIK